MKKSKNGNDNTNKHIPKDTLIIIGNGFDRWQGLDTGYGDFQKYYLLHRDEIMKKLRIKKSKITYGDGSIKELSDVELIYGDPFSPKELSENFWWDFESSLSKVDDQQLNLFFGKKRGDLKNLERSINNAKKILTTAFCDWISSLKIKEQKPEYKFGDNCVFINFNYTDTLIKRFGISPHNEYHIHGQATDPSSIVFGHSSHPEYPMAELYRFGGRFRGAFFVDRLLYETDKHIQDNIQMLSLFLALHSVKPENIKHVYVLGHSMSPVDIEYFLFLIRATTSDNIIKSSSLGNDRADPLQDKMSQTEYILSLRDRTFGEKASDDRQIYAVQRRFWAEQEERNKAVDKILFRKYGKKRKMAVSQPYGTHPTQRSEDAKWHISCHSDKDKIWVEAVMKEFRCVNYFTYKTIDECISTFKID